MKQGFVSQDIISIARAIAYAFPDQVVHVQFSSDWFAVVLHQITVFQPVRAPFLARFVEFDKPAIALLVRYRPGQDETPIVLAWRRGTFPSEARHEQS